MEEFELTKVDIDGLPWAAILESDSIDEMILWPGRRLLGLNRQRVAFNATVTWFQALKKQALLPADVKELCTVTVLAEASGHNLPLALATVLSPQVHRGDNWIGASRFAMTRSKEDSYVPYDANVTYLRMHSNAPVWCMLDTVGTGATLTRGLEMLFKSTAKPRQILLATPAGSITGMHKLASACKKEGVELKIIFFAAAFGLWEDGSGLPWCHPDTVLSGTKRSQKNIEKATQIFNNLPGFCAVGDCSANFFDVEDALKILADEEQQFGWKLPECKGQDNALQAI